MLILGIESSCDETGAAIIEGNKKTEKVKLLSNALATSLTMHSETGGIIPETAAREQVKFIIPVIKKALSDANLKPNQIDAIAVTFGPGLIGSLLVGVETAKTLSMTWNKPLIPTNHLMGHIYANFIDEQTANRLQTTAIKKGSPVDSGLSTVSREIEFPAIGLIVSGGHTDLILIKEHGNIKWLGGTRDDAAGEAMDKIGRLLNLPYPGGPHIEKLAKLGNSKKYIFPRPLVGSGDYDFSFSGLKSAVFREVQSIKKLDDENIADLCASTQKAIIDVIVRKTMKAVSEHNAQSILLGGGVAANQSLRDQIQSSIVNNKLSIKLFVPSKSLCTDNGAMIAAAAFYNDESVSWEKVNANPGLYFETSI